MKIRSINTLALAMALSVLSGCGGGGGSDDPDPPPQGCGAWPDSIVLPELGGLLTDVVPLSACDLLVSGYYGAANPIEPDGNTTAFVLQLTLGTDGNVREAWRHVVDTNGTDVVSDIEPHGDGYRYLGWTDGAQAGLTAYGKSDVLIGELAAGGALLAQSRVGDERPNRPLKLFDLTPTTHVLYGNNEVYVPTNYVAAWEDPWVASLVSTDRSYAMARMQRADTAVGDRFFSALGLDDGGAVLARGTDAGATGGLSLERRRADGTQVWHQALTHSPVDHIGSLLKTSSTTALGFGASFLNLGGGLSGGADLFVVEIDLNSGASRLVTQFGTPDTDWASAMLIDGEQMVLVSERIPAGADGWQARLSRVSLEGALVDEVVLNTFPKGAAKAVALVGEQVVVAGATGNTSASMRGWLRFVPKSPAAAP